MALVLDALLLASERAATVARSCCTGSGGESLLVSEKCEGEANTRFEKDFKTIADVLAQEAARREIASRFPELAKHVRGEECAEIGGVCIELQDAEDKTAELLRKLVPVTAAKRLAQAAHENVNVALELPPSLPKVDAGDLAVWIDPIDATGEFIAGVRGEADAEHGLPCVTVLIGAYVRSTGEPVIGVINQPFYDEGRGRIVWGVSYGGTKLWGQSHIKTDLDDKTILVSGAENPDVSEKFKSLGWNVKSVPGAGHKLLKVAVGEAAAYVVSKGTTFRWDTCAPHAILRARGGNVLCYTLWKPITYNDPDSTDTQEYSNAGGIVAFAKPEVWEEVKNILNN